MRHLLLTLLLGFSSWAFAQPGAFEADTSSAFKPWTAQEFARPTDHFQFAVIGDLTGGYRSGVFPLAVDKANAIVPDFVMSVGDLIEGYTYDTAQIQRWWNQFDKWVGALDMPFFYVPGNHDLSNALMTRLWEERYGRTYYHFVYRNNLFLVLNTEDGAPSHISERQVDYFETSVQPIAIANASYCELPPLDVAIDGRWEEWGATAYQAPAKLEYFPSSWQGIEDCGLAVRVAADEDHLYLALKVQDDDTFYTPFRHSWEQDGALFELKLPSQQGVRLGFSPMDSLLVDVQENWPIEGELKVIRNKNGFVAELKLPIAHLEQLNAAPLKQFQLQWAVYDHDRLEDQYKGTKALWRAPFPGSGTFFLPLTKP